MASEGSSESSADTREQGIEFGRLAEKLESHEYPATGDELLAAYGDFKLDLPGGSATLREILGKRESESSGEDDIRYESAEDVHQSVHNMVGSDAVGREEYTDRGGALQSEVDDGDAESL